MFVNVSHKSNETFAWLIFACDVAQCLSFLLTPMLQFDVRTTAKSL